MIDSDFSERPNPTDARHRIFYSERKPCLLSRSQASTLARLIQGQLDAYAEAAGSSRKRRNGAPLTGRDLDLLEPLVSVFHTLAHPQTAVSRKRRIRKNPKL